MLRTVQECSPSAQVKAAAAYVQTLKRNQREKKLSLTYEPGVAGLCVQGIFRVTSGFAYLLSGFQKVKFLSSLSVHQERVAVVTFSWECWCVNWWLIKEEEG
jgi:hypothetical protein